MLVTNWYKLFYWMTRADSIKGFFDSFSNVFLTFSIIFFIVWFVFYMIPYDGAHSFDISWEDEATKKRWVRPLLRCLIFCVILTLITWAGYVFTPTKKEALLIMAGGGTMKFLSTDSSAKQLPHEMTTFVVSELKSMAADAKVDLGISQAKDKIIKEAKGMTSAELIEKIQIDTNFAKIILNK